MTDAFAIYYIFLEAPLLTCLAVAITAVIVAARG